MEIIKVIKEKLIPFYHDYLVYNNLYPYSKYQQKYKCIYIHIPKTAGTSILNKLNNGKNVPRNHAFWKEYYKRSPHYYRKYFKFSFVRNPWDRAVSTYFYIKQSDAAITLINKKILRNIYEGEISTFEHFVLNFLNKDIIYSHSLLIHQWFYILMLEKLFYVYNLSKDLRV